MVAPLTIPLINGVRHSFTSIELKIKDQIFIGVTSINYSRTRSRELVRGTSADPLGKTRGDNEYSATIELYLAEFHLLMQQLGAGYGDVSFNVYVTYGENGFDTITDEIIGCTLDTTEADASQGPDPLTRSFDLNPIKIKFGGLDDLENPLQPPPEG